MFLNNLYSIVSVSEKKEENRITFELQLNSSHEIFKGHFPGNPVLPGVGTVEIIKELTSYYFNRTIMLVKAQQIKYLAFINPEVNSVIRIDLIAKESAEGLLNISASVYCESITFCSFKGEFVIQNTI